MDAKLQTFGLIHEESLQLSVIQELPRVKDFSTLLPYFFLSQKLISQT